MKPRHFFWVFVVIGAMLTSAFAWQTKPSRNPIRAYVFWSTDCPIAQRYADRLRRFLAEVAENPAVEVTLHYPNDYETPSTIETYGKDHRLPIPGSLDLDGSLARSMEMDVVPCVVIQDSRGEIAYSGPLDDNDDAALAKIPYAKNALASLMKGALPQVRSIKPMGCTISRSNSRPKDSELTWSKHVQPIMARHCISCHGPSPGSAIRLDRYADVVRWKTMVGMVVRRGSMPPIGRDPFARDLKRQLGTHSKLTQSECDLVLDWLSGRLQLGDPPQPNKTTPVKSQGIRVLQKDYAIPSGGRWHEEGTTMSLPRNFPTSVSGYRLEWDDPSFIRWATIRLQSKNRTVTLGTWTMGDPQEMRLRERAAVETSPGDHLTLEIHAFGNPLPQRKRATLTLIAGPQNPKWKLRTVILESPNLDLQPMQVKTVTLQRQLQIPVTWLWIRPTSSWLRGTSALTLDSRAPLFANFYGRDWQPQFDLPTGSTGRTLSVRSSLANKNLVPGEHGAPPQAIQEKFKVEAAYLQP